YSDKLEGKIPADFWERKMSDWRTEEQQVQLAIAGAKDENREGVQTVQRILELANKAYFLYLTQNPAEQADLLRTVVWNCSIDAVSLTPAYRKPFNLIS